MTPKEFGLAFRDSPLSTTANPKKNRPATTRGLAPSLAATLYAAFSSAAAIGSR